MSKYNKLYLFAGHGGSDPGALGKFGPDERELTKELRNMIAVNLRLKGITPITDNDSFITRQVLRAFNFNERDLVFDIHFNSHINESATGTETFVPSRYTETEWRFGMEIASATAKTLSIRNRGVKSESQTARGKIGVLNVKGTNVLWEVCFMSNPNDHQAYQDRKEKLAESIADVIAREFKS